MSQYSQKASARSAKQAQASDEQLIRDAHSIVMKAGAGSAKEALEQAQQLLECEGRTGLSAKLSRFLALHNESTTQGDLLEELIAYSKDPEVQGGTKGSTSKAKSVATSKSEKSAG